MDEKERNVSKIEMNAKTFDLSSMEADRSILFFYHSGQHYSIVKREHAQLALLRTVILVKK